MNRKEFATVMGVIETAYNNFEILNNEPKMEIWYDSLKDLDYQECGLAVKRIMMENTFAPMIATIRIAVRDSRPQLPTAGEAWSEVELAIKKYGMKLGRTAIESMTPITSKIVAGLGWWELCNSTNQSTDRAHFLKMYKEIADKERQEQLMPPKLKNKQIEADKQKKLTEGKGDK